jgi:transposase
MNAYSEDLRSKIVEALRRGTTKSEAARAFGVSRSSVKRYARLVEEGRPLAPRKRPGSKPKMDESARRLLEADVERRPAATLSERREFLERVAGLRVSESTVSRMLRRLLGWSRKKVGGCERTRRVLEGSLAGSGRRGDLRRAVGVRR